MKLLKKYKWFILGFFILFVIIAGWIFKDFLLNTDGALYGHRLEGIEDAPIGEETKKSNKDFLLETEGVKSVNTNLHGRIFNVIVKVEEAMTVDKIKEVTNSSLEKFTKEQKEFYDISFFIDYEKETEATAFPIIGYKNKNNDQIVW